MDFIKLLALIALLTSLQPGISVYGQQSPPLISLSEKNVPLEKILDIIEKKTGYTVFGDATWTQLATKVTINVENETIPRVLEICFKNQPLEYMLDHRSINIRVMELFNGRLVNERDEPVPSGTIQLSGTNRSVISNDSGKFSIRAPDKNAVLLISSVNFEAQELRIAGGGKSAIIHLKEKIGELSDVAVVINTGYQRLPKERATGSFSKINTGLIDRRVSTNILDRLDGVTSSVLFNKNNVLQTNSSTISIRGRSTIFANPEPLIIVDNFPYNGNIYNINPEDVESVTVLKDAAAASIWGAFAGNGVIVITTKQGKYRQEPRLHFSTSLNVGGKPDLYYLPVLSSGDYIDVERYLFGKNFYNVAETGPGHVLLSPVTEILIKERDGLLSPAEAESQLNLLRGQDTRRDLDKYFYRGSLNQQYFLSLNGGGSKNQYYFSAGFDKNITNLVRNQYDRVTLNGNNTYILCPKKLELSTGFAFTSSITKDNNSGDINTSYPYVRLADANGRAQSVPADLRQSYKDTAGGGQLLDWNYRPLDELHNADNSTHLTDYRVNIGIRYLISKGFDAHAYYQYGHGSADHQNLQSQQMYYSRNLINEYTQMGMGMLMRPVPLGAILDVGDTGYSANNVRVQLNYEHKAGPDGVLTAIAGAELRDVEGSVRNNRLYGYNKDLQSSQPVNYAASYPQYSNGVLRQIPYLDHNESSSDHYLSYYFNGSYNFHQRFVLSASARKDESNIFGVKANRKGVPLWSVGAAWEISKEDFYRLAALPFLKLRVTDGYNGNVDKTVSAYTTALINTGFNIYGAASASITNPPNPSLGWEQIHIVNMGVDFASRGNRIEGSLEYYLKNGYDLIGLSPLDPTTGNTQFRGNTAGMKTHGVDFVLNTKNIDGAIRWNTSFLFSFARDKVTRYDTSRGTGSIINYLNSNIISPLEGHPLYSVYALRWMGLDPQTGDPQGLLNGHISKDYTTLSHSSDFSNLIYKGTANPSIFGSLRNSVYWKKLGLSFTILYKFGYYFRRSSINYSDLFSGISRGHPDFDKRWLSPGDEKRTSVPSMDYPADPARDLFYSQSEVLVEKGDHIRLQDIRISYDLQKSAYPRLPVRAMQIYLYANNIGILWKANHQGIDPDNIQSIPNPRTLAVGIKLDL
ncbi:MAG TPA: SusC/RagA family TonB-linked outer membrane protein [Puia sp.]|nr:SusC/RagA family TonB-linked outer membrane protein [Puia sp.]